MTGQDEFWKTENINDSILRGPSSGIESEDGLGDVGQLQEDDNMNGFSIVKKTGKRDLATVEIQRSGEP